ncbi:hypothetical protein SCHPADRAFT_423615 [Schizopora paradoxa]|uniref:Uncharacterized protein n=1 Tax=Schizopora paradoxa TaxID=27342 RepID=A0A0H2RK94_9AGAM|nr:hypothetical protein SCHPADRAFT_423615 [Schizopora paradoxa]
MGGKALASAHLLAWLQLRRRRTTCGKTSRTEAADDLASSCEPCHRVACPVMHSVGVDAPETLLAPSGLGRKGRGAERRRERKDVTDAKLCPTFGERNPGAHEAFNLLMEVSRARFATRGK